ncbi:hypothetical protein EMIHUDRAFT_111909 [Emiliania huxleyi CCMP1516]|uniref:F-box domain-containing protein n=2 Tax=Emiliania huxleyi TaxID=2903 RepID=A0A0D3KC58_EMIH1|nr:hypothetical protein EMIHUDRAFT_111909 [Emiliania huxleyi CCMP1516]EOD33343.1 hypothetical protein EMIHUDRAFT_111909 [Emiliania huxleyi CCMP1516]|eukprot:XP_005785772.1 hypothetical protein EMIHUDRAFT_111909 [Emiliania huxleyi CCMP1516]
MAADQLIWTLKSLSLSLSLSHTHTLPCLNYSKYVGTTGNAVCGLLKMSASATVTDECWGHCRGTGRGFGERRGGSGGLSFEASVALTWDFKRRVQLVRSPTILVVLPHCVARRVAVVAVRRAGLELRGRAEQVERKAHAQARRSAASDALLSSVRGDLAFNKQLNEQLVANQAALGGTTPATKRPHESEAARKEAAAARHTDDTFLGKDGRPRVRLELDIVEEIMLQLSPKVMAVAARVNRHFLQAVERAIPARLRPPPPPPKPGEPQLPNDPRRRNLGLAVDADKKVTTELLSQLEKQVKQVDLSGQMAWRIAVNGKPTPAWAQRNKSAVEAALRASGPYSDPIQTDLCVLFRLMPASVAEEHVEGIGAVLARIAERGSGSHFQIGILLDLLAKLSLPALVGIRAKIDECRSACLANHALNHLAPKVRALLAQADGASI